MTFSQIRRFILSEDGPTAVEYAVLVGLIAVGAGRVGSDADQTVSAVRLAR